MFIPNKRTLLSMVVTCSFLLGLGSAAPAFQNPRLGSNISVESSRLLDLCVKPPLTNRICNDKVLKRYKFYNRYLCMY